MTDASDRRHARTRGWWTRRAIVLAVVGAQLFAIVYAYDVPNKVFGWQMFNASSDWQAENRSGHRRRSAPRRP